MKFIHIADLHLGKVLHQYSLLSLQREALMELLEYAKKETISIIVIAGDIYDRFIPSQEAVNVLDEFLSKALLKYHIKVLMISGNHDSSDRLNFGSSILKQEGLFIETRLQETMKQVTFNDEQGEVVFHLLPFVKPSGISQCFKDAPTDTYQRAFEYYMSQQRIDTSKRNVLITHQFIGGGITSSSELPLSVGGSEIIDYHLFDEFDYVALGHLHAPQKIKRESMRYSGSLLRYSFDEVNQEKSFVVVDMKEKGNMTLSYSILHPSLQVRKESGHFEEFLKDDKVERKNDLLSFDLLDHQMIPQAIDLLRLIYPNLLQIRYTFFTKEDTVTNHKIKAMEEKNITELFSSFYQEVKGEALAEDVTSIVHTLFDEVGEHHETN